MTDILIGIDPGVKTGFAVWDIVSKEFKYIQTVSIVRGMSIIAQNHKDWAPLEIWFEDARQRKWFGSKGREALQGAGSIKRDCKIWQEFCEYHQIPFKALPPQKGKTKWTSEYFKRLTGWQGRTSEHARDAAALVFGK